MKKISLLFIGAFMSTSFLQAQTSESVREYKSQKTYGYSELYFGWNQWSNSDGKAANDGTKTTTELDGWNSTTWGFGFGGNSQLGASKFSLRYGIQFNWQYFRLKGNTVIYKDSVTDGTSFKSETSVNFKKSVFRNSFIDVPVMVQFNNKPRDEEGGLVLAAGGYVGARMDASHKAVYTDTFGDKSKDKLPTWFEVKNIYFPPKISIEQTSSEQTAKYKSELISGKNLIDLTGGFGVDDYYFSKQFESIIHCELNEELSQITAHNFEQLGVDNCTFYCGDGMQFLKETEEKFDWIYLDPSRRSEVKGKVFLMADCLPDVPNNLNLLFSKTDNVLMKTSPLIDFSQGLKELKWVKEIHVVALKNEVKELLWIIEKDYEGEVQIKTMNLEEKGNQLFDFVLNEEGKIDCELSLPKQYLYEPNSAVMKSGGFNEVGIQAGLSKLHKHSHLYTGDELIEFSGRRFVINEIISVSGKELKSRFKGKKANVTTRNYPQKVEEIRKSLKIKDGGEVYLFFTTTMNEGKICLVCDKVN